MKTITRPINVLLVDDDDGDAKTLKRAFHKLGLDKIMTHARDALEALDYLKGKNGKDRLKRPCILLVDLNMPRVNGLELIRIIRDDDDLKKLVIFILTTSDLEEDKQAAYKLHVAGYIVKQTANDNFASLADFVERYCKTVDLPL
ncbi:MAG: response regulator [Alphaproteobacteria bacterium]|nr:response regulator [Alphaproteobacteria bacterium]